jgi:hypothetical protein
MMDRERALKIMGLKEGAADREIEHRYFILMKKSRTGNAEETGQDAPSMDEITEAYNVLTGKVVEEEEYTPSPLFRKLNLDERKVRNFFHYYKWHIVIGIISIIALISFIKSVSKPRPDFNIAFIGEIYYIDGAERLRDKVETELESVSLASVDGASFLLEEMEYDMNMKAMVLLAGGDIDVFITDGSRFRIYAEQGAFMKLEDVSEELGIAIDDDDMWLGKAEEDDRRYLYGIDVTDNELLKELGIIGKEMIISIRVNTKNYEKSVDFLRLVLKGSQAK